MAKQKKKSSNPAHILGERGEEAAARFLEKQGYEILEQNWECRHGEADLIMCDEDTLVFVEVKTRSNCEKGLPEEAITKDKRTRYEKIAVSYLKKSDFRDIAIRFDVVSILVVSADRAFLRHHVNAFGVGD